MTCDNANKFSNIIAHAGDEMKWNNALIYTTIWSYAAAAVSAMLGYPAMEADIFMQTALYFAMALLLFIALSRKEIRPYLAGLYGCLAMISFSGIQKWISYNGTTSLGPWMALWDLALAIALLET